jgi:hypothetical protein
MLEDLNIDNVAKVLNRSNLSDYNFMMYNSNNLANYHIVIKSLLDNFFEYYQVDNFKFEKNTFEGGTTLINKKFTNLWMKDITEIRFINLYPNIIIRLWEQKLLTFNINEFGVLFKFLVQNKDAIKNKLTNRNKGLLNFIINYTFGAGHNINSVIKINGLDLVVTYIKNTLIDLYTNYSNNVFYIDVDVIYLDFLDKTILDKYIIPLGLPYTIEHHLGGFFIQKKKYILETKNGIRTYGIEKFESENKIQKERIKKINIIKSKL